MSSSLAGAEMMTFFAPASRCARAAGPLVNRPVDSITMSTPRSRQGRLAGSRSARILIDLSPTRMTSPDADTSAGRVPITVSYLSRCAMVAMSPRSLAATISKPRSPSAALTARQKLRPIRPNPLIPTRMVTVQSLLVDPRDRQRSEDYRTPSPRSPGKRSQITCRERVWGAYAGQACSYFSGLDHIKRWNSPAERARGSGPRAVPDSGSRAVSIPAPGVRVGGGTLASGQRQRQGGSE